MSNWKQHERDVAKAFGGVRRGPMFRDPNGGTSDVIAEGWSIETKLLARPAWTHFRDAVAQARAAAKPDEIPLAVVRKARSKDKALVVMDLVEFLEWFGPEPKETT